MISFKNWLKIAITETEEKQRCRQKMLGFLTDNPEMNGYIQTMRNDDNLKGFMVGILSMITVVAFIVLIRVM